MKRTLRSFALGAMCCLLFAGCTAKEPVKDPVDYVYMYIGTINPKTRGAVPVIKVPDGQVSLFPTFTSMTDWYFADKIHGFPVGVGSVMVSSGDVKTGTSAVNASRFDHDHEIATPYYYQVLLEDPDVNTEFTTTDNVILFRFTLPANQTSNILLSLNGLGSADIKDNRTIEGFTETVVTARQAEPRTVRNNFYAEVSKPAQSSGTWGNGSAISATTASFTSVQNSGLYLTYKTGESAEVVELKVGTSPQSSAQAADYVKNQIASSSFDQIKAKARDRWNEELSVIKIKGGTEKQRSLFYTTLHRTRSLRMGNVWDTYRGAYPLQALIRPGHNTKTINDWLKAYDETGWLPSSGAMIGHHSTSVIVDSYFRGVRGFDVEKAYEAMKKNAMEATMIPWKDGMYVTELEQCYFNNGYYPALPVRSDFVPDSQNPQIDKYEKLPYQARWMPETGVEEWVKEVDPWHRRQSVSVTLEHCYDDWCLAMMAKELGKTEDYEYFMKRAHNYQNLYKSEIGLMAPKDASGKWIEPFDPKYSGNFAGEGYFAEGNSWAYSWHVQHDVQGLINLMGGREKFLDKLNELFVTGHKMDKQQFLAQMPDMTGLMGMYCHGNEPSFHIPYMYNYAGQPWMTQNKVRQMMELWYDTTPFGLSGDEDGGAMSAWYTLSSMGFYPQCPGNPIWDIGSPLFEESTIHFDSGKSFTIKANNTSAQNKYIQSATLNGKAHTKPWFTHEDMVNGGTLVLEMGPRPNKSWGASPADAAYSMSKPL